MSIVTTDDLIESLARGERIYLPAVHIGDDTVRNHYAVDDLERLTVDPAENDIVSIEYLGEEEVQCIEVADARHLYVTDDFIPTHNTSNIIFLKSTDDAMIEQLEKMSGKVHRTRATSKQVTQQTDKMVGGKNDGAISTTYSTAEEPLIRYNNFAFLPPNNSIVLRAGDAPIWNRNQSIMPMSWQLFDNKIIHPGHQYTLQDIPTQSTSIDFDVNENIPNFIEMLTKRVKQANATKFQVEAYKTAYGLNDASMMQRDSDILAADIMTLITSRDRKPDDGDKPVGDADDDFDAWGGSSASDEDFTENAEAVAEIARVAAFVAASNERKFAEGTVSPSMLVKESGEARLRTLDAQISEAYRQCENEMGADSQFIVGDDSSLRSVTGQVFITRENSSQHAAAVRKFRDAATDEDSHVYAENPTDVDAIGSLSPAFKIHAAFYTFLAKQDSWSFADGAFDRAMAIEMRSKGNAVS